MSRASARALLASLLLVACSGGSGGDVASDAPAQPTVPPDTSSGGAASAQQDATHDASTPDADAGADAGPSCKKTITVVSAVGTGSKAVGSHSNGCWKVIDADGAANAQYRKCSTAKLMVQNASAPNFAYDDTNPDHVLSQETTFLSQCASGATGIGFEYMAYRGAWRLLAQPKVVAYFEELYSSDLAVDDYLAHWDANVNGKATSPMINFGPNDATKIRTSGLTMCNKVPDGGYFGMYDGDWENPMADSDARAVALGTALNDCTKK
ncbi:MAG TPA: hypothetical protein VIF62_30530 [Labilithrix sp.]